MSIRCDDGTKAYGVLKAANLDDAYEMNAIENELKILSQLQHHDHVVRLLAWAPVVSENRIRVGALLLGPEAMSLGELLRQGAERLKKDPSSLPHGIFPKHTWLMLLRQAVNAVQNLHALRVVHLDVKPDNILLDESWSRLRICDFGLSANGEGLLMEGMDVSVGHGTPGYRDCRISGRPEGSEAVQLCPLMDYYSLAVVACEMMLLVSPEEVLRMHADGTLYRHLPKGEMRDILIGALSTDMAKRWQGVDWLDAIRLDLTSMAMRQEHKKDASVGVLGATVVALSGGSAVAGAVPPEDDVHEDTACAAPAADDGGHGRGSTDLEPATPAAGGSGEECSFFQAGTGTMHETLHFVGVPVCWLVTGPVSGCVRLCRQGLRRSAQQPGKQPAQAPQSSRLQARRRRVQSRRRSLKSGRRRRHRRRCRPLCCRRCGHCRTAWVHRDWCGQPRSATIRGPRMCGACREHACRTPSGCGRVGGCFADANVHASSARTGRLGAHSGRQRPR